MSPRIFGCCNPAIVLISRRKRSAPITAESSGRSTLLATLRSCFMSSARHTVAMPPAPSARSHVTPDGTQFLILQPTSGDARGVLVSNWARELRRRLREAR